MVLTGIYYSATVSSMHNLCLSKGMNSAWFLFFDFRQVFFGITRFHWNQDKNRTYRHFSPVSLPAAVYFSEHNVVYPSSTLLTISSCIARQNVLFLTKLIGFTPFSVYCIVISERIAREADEIREILRANSVVLTY